MKALIAANWKMQGDASWVDKPYAFDDLLAAQNRTDIEVLICPPFPLIGVMAVICQAAQISLGAQNCHHADSGAHTGEVSAALLASIGTQYVITGHSERRAEGETDADVMAKSQAALRHGLTPIICVGESLKQREAGKAMDIVSAQLQASMPGGKRAKGEIVIAYEPIWAIGTGKVPTIEDITAMHDMVRDSVGKDTRILYGGSVKPSNAKEILAIDNVNGALIGGASLEMDSLADIAKAAL